MMHWNVFARSGIDIFVPTQNLRPILSHWHFRIYKQPTHTILGKI